MIEFEKVYLNWQQPGFIDFVFMGIDKSTIKVREDGPVVIDPKKVTSVFPAGAAGERNFPAEDGPYTGIRMAEGFPITVRGFYKDVAKEVGTDGIAQECEYCGSGGGECSHCGAPA